MNVSTDKLYKIRGESQILKLKKAEQFGIFVFVKVDENGKPVKNENGFHPSVEIVTERIVNLIEFDPSKQQPTLF